MNKNLSFIVITLLVTLVVSCSPPSEPTPSSPTTQPEPTTVEPTATEPVETTPEAEETPVEDDEPTDPYAEDGPIDFTYETSDGVELAGTLHGPADSSTVVILGPQYPGEQAGWLPFAEAAADAGIRSITFDLRGYGESEGERNDLDIPTDIEAMLTFAQNELAPEHIVLIGAVQSGTASAKLAGTGADIDGVVVLSAPQTTNADGLTVSESELAAIEVPSLWITARQDLLQNIEAMHEAAGSANKEIWIYETSAVPGTELFNGLDAADLERRLLEFINQF